MRSLTVSALGLPETGERSIHQTIQKQTHKIRRRRFFKLKQTLVSYPSLLTPSFPGICDLRGVEVRKLEYCQITLADTPFRHFLLLFFIPWGAYFEPGGASACMQFRVEELEEETGGWWWWLVVVIHLQIGDCMLQNLSVAANRHRH